MEGLICRAIRHRKVISFAYADNKGSIHTRLVEPYAHGITRQGNEALRGYQIGGTSESAIPGWKIFLVERMAGLRVTEQSFAGTAPGYAHGDKDLNPIHCRIP